MTENSHREIELLISQQKQQLNTETCGIKY